MKVTVKQTILWTMTSKGIIQNPNVESIPGQQSPATLTGSGEQSPYRHDIDVQPFAFLKKKPQWPCTTNNPVQPLIFEGQEGRVLTCKKNGLKLHLTKSGRVQRVRFLNELFARRNEGLWQ